MPIYKILAIINVILIAFNFYLYRYIKANFFELRAMGSIKEDIYAIIKFLIIIITTIMIVLFILGI